MFPTVQPGTAMTVKETRAGEACILIIIITGPFFCPIRHPLGKMARGLAHIAPVHHPTGIMPCEIAPIAEANIASFREAVDAVMRERKYLVFLEAPPLENMKLFVSNNIKCGYPQL